MNLHKRAVTAIGYLADFMLGERPTKQPFGFLGTHVDTAMTHGHTKILVPVGSVKGVARNISDEKSGELKKRRGDRCAQHQRDDRPGARRHGE